MQVKLDEADVGAYADTRKLEKVCLYKKKQKQNKTKKPFVTELSCHIFWIFQEKLGIQIIYKIIHLKNVVSNV